MAKKSTVKEKPIEEKVNKKDEIVQVERMVNKDGKKVKKVFPYRREIAERLVAKGCGTIVKITVERESPGKKSVKETELQEDKPKENTPKVEGIL